MNQKFITGILYALPMLFLQMNGISQAGINRITKLNGNAVHFNTGDSLELISLKDTNYQLIVLAFHAEEDTIGLDPGLSVNGRWRAINLNKLFKDVNFKSYFTTPFRNNILTLQPLMDYKKAVVSYYDQAGIQTLSENIKQLYPAPVIIMVHPETVAGIYEQLTEQKFSIHLTGNLSEKLIFIQRSKSQPAICKEFRYSIR
jgi:hypothetical protein